MSMPDDRMCSARTAMPRRLSRAAACAPEREASLVTTRKGCRLPDVRNDHVERIGLCQGRKPNRIERCQKDRANPLHAQFHCSTPEFLNV